MRCGANMETNLDDVPTPRLLSRVALVVKQVSLAAKHEQRDARPINALLALTWSTMTDCRPFFSSRFFRWTH